MDGLEVKQMYQSWNEPSKTDWTWTSDLTKN